MKVAQSIIDILANSRVEGNFLYLPPGQLDRQTYVAVNKVIEALGGKWQKKGKNHQFNEDIEEKLAEVINTGEYTDQKKELNYFPTPNSLAKRMVELAELKENDLVLETSAGQGAILEEMIKVSSNFSAFEIDDNNCKFLREKFGDKIRGRLICGDFLGYKTEGQYDKVTQNPPFNMKGRSQCEVDFILHAFNFLKPGGILVSVCSASPFFRTNKKSVDFRAFLEENNAQVIDLPEGSFKESGTMVRTKLVKIVKSAK